MLDEILARSRHSIDPRDLIDKKRRRPDAALYLGKVSLRFFQSFPVENALLITSKPSHLPKSLPHKVIWAEHPIPGKGSFRAGAEILKFFRELDEKNCRTLEIFLSGGASSMAWLKPDAISERELLRRLRILYRLSLTIRELNRERSKLCELKNGGATKLLKALAPGVRARVFLISDVLPFSARYVGSGPFWDGKISHEVLADNSSWVDAIAKESRKRKLKVIHKSSGETGPWSEWVEKISRKIDRGKKRSGVLIFGGEPQVHLPASSKFVGGRLTHLALALLIRYFDEIRSGKVEMIFSSSDGSDGSSRSSGVRLNSN